MNTTFAYPPKMPATIGILLTSLAVAFALLASQSQAQVTTYDASTVAGHPPGVDTSGGVTIIVHGDDCRRLQKYVASGDVAFKPGVGVGGEKVAPADLSPAPAFGNGDDLDFSFTVRLKDALASDGADSTSDIIGEAPIGRIEFKGGVVSFNGVPLAQDQLQAVSEGCLAARNTHEKRKKKK